MSDGVSVGFFCAAIKALEKSYPDRLCKPWEQVERFRALLAEAEQVYAAFERGEPRSKRRKAKTPEATEDKA